MKRTKKALAALLSVLMLMLTVCPAAFALEDTPGKDYTITSPYATVDWDTWNSYKANLHAHSTYSDGEMTLSEVVESYYAKGYDILAVTDHGVLGKTWTEEAQMMPVIGYYAYIGKYDVLSDLRYEAITTGSDRDGRGMLNVTTGIELNAVVIRKNHVNGFFCDFGYDYWGEENDYESAVRLNAEAGGITFLNHLGDWTGGGGDVTKNQDPETIQFFSDIFVKYPSCVGMEIINRIDSVTKHDRVLWDNILQVVIPQGRNVFAFSNDDSHCETDIGLSFETFMMPELTQDALRTAMENGTFFACGRRARAELGDDFFADIYSPYPTVTNITVNDATNCISVDYVNGDKIEWVADGVVIAEGNTIDLNDYEDEISSYVRFQIRGDGGMCFSQAFICDDGTLGEDVEPIYTPTQYPEFIQILINLFKILWNTKIGALIQKNMD